MVESSTNTRNPLWWNGHGWVPGKSDAAKISRTDAEALLKKMGVDEFLLPTCGAWKFPTMVEDAK